MCLGGFTFIFQQQPRGEIATLLLPVYLQVDKKPNNLKKTLSAFYMMLCKAVASNIYLSLV